MSSPSSSRGRRNSERERSQGPSRFVSPPPPVQRGRKPQKKEEDDASNPPKKRGKKIATDHPSQLTKKSKESSEPMEVDPIHTPSNPETDSLHGNGLVKLRLIFGKEETRPPKKLLEGTIARFKEYYKDIRNEYDELVNKELNEEFSQWLDVDADEENVYQKNLRAQNIKIPRLEFSEIPEERRIGHTTVTWLKPDRDENNTLMKNVKVPCVRFEVGDLKPPMNYWIPIEQSIVSKDQHRLTHIPYFNDAQDDTELYDQLSKVFSDGVHGYCDNWDYVNDWILYKMMRVALESCHDDKNMDPDIIYYAIYRIWPNKMTQTELSEAFPKLCELFAEDGFDPSKLEPWKKEKPQEVAENLRNPICYSCLSFMCPIHGFKPEIPPEFPAGEFYNIKIPLPDDANFCGSQRCWKSMGLEAAVLKLKPSEEELERREVSACLDKARLLKLPIEDGAMIASQFPYNADLPFCEFAEKVVDDEDEEDSKFTTCYSAYELILSLAEQASDARLYLEKTTKPMDSKDRCQAFRREKLYQEKEKRRIRHDQLREKAARENLDVVKLIAEDDRREQLDNAEAVRLQAVTPITACRHAGPCTTTAEDCACRENGLCSYMCKCDINCPQRFPGCNCSAGQCYTKACQCFRARWECNPMTCTSCQCDKIDSQMTGCANYAMTRSVQKKMYVAPSKIAGNGLFILEPCEKDEFITEYVGERISDDEAERRGAIYDRYRCSYIFNLETGGAIDAYKVGNLARFANHEAVNPNCYARTMVVAGEHRIGLYAKQKLEINDELTFDYSYSGEHQKVFKKSKKNR